jgi:hypothetical protein
VSSSVGDVGGQSVEYQTVLRKVERDVRRGFSGVKAELGRLLLIAYWGRGDG